jgi:hypothetical protein
LHRRNSLETQLGEALEALEHDDWKNTKTPQLLYIASPQEKKPVLK